MSGEPPSPPDLPPEANPDPLTWKRKEFEGLSAVDAIRHIAASLQELNAKLAVQPLPGKGNILDNVTKIVEAVGNGISKVKFGGGTGSFEKEASQMFLDIGRETLKTTILSNRALQRRLGGEVLSSTAHVVVQG